MKYRLVFRKVAQAEFDGAAIWYEKQRLGLGIDFIERVEQVLENIANNPTRFPIADGDVHEAQVSRFPYCVYYRVKADHVVILSVFHTSRNPEVWQQR